jgi:hypothetical protein
MPVIGGGDPLCLKLTHSYDLIFAYSSHSTQDEVVTNPQRSERRGSSAAPSCPSCWACCVWGASPSCILCCCPLFWQTMQKPGPPPGAQQPPEGPSAQLNAAWQHTESTIASLEGLISQVSLDSSESGGMRVGPCAEGAHLVAPLRDNPPLPPLCSSSLPRMSPFSRSSRVERLHVSCRPPHSAAAAASTARVAFPLALNPYSPLVATPA